MTDPFDGRSEMSAEEYRAYLDGQLHPTMAQMLHDATPDWQTSEKAFMAKVVKYATEHGWLTYHTWKSANSAPGFPDLVLLRRDQLIFAELKVGTYKMSKAQCRWFDWLSLVSWEAKKSGFDRIGVYLWRPEMWDEIEEVLG